MTINKFLVIFSSLFFAIPSLAQESGAEDRIKRLTNQIRKTAHNFDHYNEVTRVEKRRLVRGLRQLKNVMEELGMNDIVTGGGSSRFYCDGLGLYILETGRYNRQLSSSAVCEKVIRSSARGIRYYCDGRSMYETESGRYNRQLTKSSICEKVVQAVEIGKSHYCDGLSLYNTETGRYNRQLSSSEVCEQVADNL